MPRLLVLPLFVLALSGCSLFGGSDGDDCGSGAVATGSLSATVAGEGFVGICLQGQFDSGTLAVGGNLGAEGTPVQEQINLTIQGAQPGQTYAFGLSNPGLIAVYSALDASDPTDASGVYTANAVAGTGSITVDAVSEAGASGTFSFTGRNNDGQTLAVTSGRFDLEF